MSINYDSEISDIAEKWEMSEQHEKENKTIRSYLESRLSCFKGPF